MTLPPLRFMEALRVSSVLSLTFENVPFTGLRLFYSQTLDCGQAPNFGACISVKSQSPAVNQALCWARGIWW